MDDEIAELFYVLIRHCINQPAPDALPETEQHKLTATVYVLIGEYKNNFPPEAVIRQARKVFGNLQAVEIIPGVGHGMTTERPDVINVYLRNFLEATV